MAQDCGYIRKLQVLEDVVYRERGIRAERPIRRVAVGAVIQNPYAGRYSEDLRELVSLGAALGDILTAEACRRLDGQERVHSFGKAAIVGSDGELEHAAALLHPEFGKSIRRVLGDGKAITPSSKKVAAAGAVIDVPLHYRNAAYVRSHFDAMEYRICDAPRPDEIVAILVLTDGGRPFPRVGGLRLEEVVGVDGLR